MNAQHLFTKADALDLVGSTAWQRLVMHLMQQVWAQSQSLVGLSSEARALVIGSMAAVRDVITHVYRTAERESPLEAMQDMRWMREWLGFVPLIEREEWAKFRAWQAEQAMKNAGPRRDPETPDPWTSTRGKQPSGLV